MPVQGAGVWSSLVQDVACCAAVKRAKRSSGEERARANSGFEGIGARVGRSGPPAEATAPPPPPPLEPPPYRRRCRNDPGLAGSKPRSRIAFLIMPGAARGSRSRRGAVWAEIDRLELQTLLEPAWTGAGRGSARASRRRNSRARLPTGRRSKPARSQRPAEADPSIAPGANSIPSGSLKYTCRR